MQTESSVDQLLDALRHPYRRHILRLIADQNPRGEAEFVAEPPAQTRHEPERLLIQLRHVHLPKLANAEYVDWDAEAGDVRRGPAFSTAESGLQLLDELQDDLAPDTT